MPTLTVNTRSLTDTELEGVLIYVTLDPAMARPIFHGGAAIYPEKLVEKTDASGVATFELIASHDLDDPTKYEIVINWSKDRIDRYLFFMPADDIGFSDIVSGTQPARLYDIAVGWSDDAVAVEAELTAASESLSVVIPNRGSNGYLVLWTADAHGAVSEIHIGAGMFNEINTFGAAVALNRGGIPGTVRVSVNQRIANLLSGETLRVVFA